MRPLLRRRGRVEIEAARGRLQCHDLEEPLERQLERAGASGESLIAFALRG